MAICALPKPKEMPMFCLLLVVSLYNLEGKWGGLTVMSLALLI